jgi:hypothetical protein
MSVTDYSKYDQLLEQARGSAKYWIPKLCQALREENAEMSNEDIKERVKKDCSLIWQRGTITDALPEEYKDKTRSGLGKKGRQKQLRSGGSTVLEELDTEPDSNRANNGSDSSTGQESQTFDEQSLEKMESQLQSQLNNAKQELVEAKEMIASLQERKKVEDVQSMDNERDRLVGADRVTKISERDKKGCAVFVNKFRELIQRRITNVGRASIRFSILANRKNTKSEFLIPVIFKVNFNDMSTSLVLDESRI